MMVFRSTFDFAKVLGEDIPVYLECLKVVADECGGIYPQQYKELSAFIKVHSINDIESIAFNQTSINCASDFFLVTNTMRQQITSGTACAQRIFMTILEKMRYERFIL